MKKIKNLFGFYCTFLVFFVYTSEGRRLGIVPVDSL